jgi:hypothetical protein
MKISVYKFLPAARGVLFFVLSLQVCLAAPPEQQREPGGTTASKFILVPYPSCRPYAGLVDNLDGTLTDPRSGLVWNRCDVGSNFVKGKGCVGKTLKKYSWMEAMKMAKESRQGGHNDWRLPNIEEVESIADSSDNCSRYGSYHQNGTAAVDLRLLVQEYYEVNHFIHTMEVFHYTAWGGSDRDLTQPLRTGYSPMNHNGEDIHSGGAAVRLVRQSTGADDGMPDFNRFYAQYVDAAAARAEQERRQRLADEAARAAAAKAMQRKIDAAKE